MSRFLYVSFVLLLSLQFHSRLHADFLVANNFGDQTGTHVLRYDDNGNFIRVEVATGANGFGDQFMLGGATGLAISGNELLVSNQNTGEILRFDSTNQTFLGTFASSVTGPTQLFNNGNNIFSGSLDLADNTALTDVQLFGTDGSALGSFTSGGSLQGVSSFIFGNDGDLYAGDFNGGEIEVFDGVTGEFKSTFATGLGVNGVTGLTFDGAGNLWFSSLFTNEVLQLDPNGVEINRFSTGGPGTGLQGDGTFPSSIALNPDGSGELLIALAGNAGIFRFDTSGNNLGQFTTGDNDFTTNPPTFRLLVPGNFIQVAAVPEPTHAVILVGAFLLGGVTRRRT